MRVDLALRMVAPSPYVISPAVGSFCAGPGLQMEQLVGDLTKEDEARMPGIRNVMHSRCKTPESLALARALAVEDLDKIGKGPRCEMRRLELARLRTLATSTADRYRALDPRIGSAAFYAEQLWWLQDVCGRRCWPRRREPAAAAVLRKCWEIFQLLPHQGQHRPF